MIVIRTGTLCASLLLLPAVLNGQERSAELDYLGFLVGQWSTSSVTVRGDTIPGDLAYQWVLGGQWVKVTFEGHPADGSLWEAHAMITFDAEHGEFVSYAFFGVDGPRRSRGSLLDDGTVRFESEAEGRTTGIDYHDTGDGTVYQENWALSATGERAVTLRTTYTPVE